MEHEFDFPESGETAADLNITITEIVNGDDLTEESICEAWAWFRQQIEQQERTHV